MDKKFLSKCFRIGLLEIVEESMDKQEQVLDETIERWRGDNEQLDDICVFGVRIKK